MCSGITLSRYEQVLPERARATHRRQVAMRRGHHAHIDSNGRLVPSGVICALLQHAQELRLHRERHVADLVEKERAAMRFSKRPRRSHARR